MPEQNQNILGKEMRIKWSGPHFANSKKRDFYGSCCIRKRHPGINPDFAGINELFEDRRVILYLGRMWYVYILKCGNGNLYTGITDNLERRFKEHASGKGGHFTKAFGAKKMLYSEPCVDKSSALKREARIKSWTRKEKLALIRAAP